MTSAERAFRNRGRYEFGAIGLLGLACSASALAMQVEPVLLWVNAGHGRATSVDWSSDGQLVASSGEDSTVKIWDASEWQLVRTLGDFINWPEAVRFSPDTKLVAMVATNNLARIWRVADGAIVQEWRGLPYRSMAFSPHGLFIALGAGDPFQSGTNVVELRRLTDGTLIYQTEVERETIRSIDFAPDGLRFATAGRDIRVRRTQDGAVLLTIPATGYRLDWSADGRWLATSLDAHISLWDADTGELVRSLVGHNDLVNWVQFSSDSSLLVSASGEASQNEGNNSLRLWNVKTGEQIRQVAEYEARVYGAAFSRDGQSIACAAADRTVRIWPTEGGRSKRLTFHKDNVQSVATSHDGRWVASSALGGDNRILLWNAAEGRMSRSFSGPVREDVWLCAFSADNALLAGAFSDGRVRVWSVDTGLRRFTFSRHRDDVRALAFSPVEPLLASAGDDRIIILWNMITGRPLRKIHAAHTREISTLAISPDGALLASGSLDRTVRIWNIDTRALEHTLTGHPGQISSVSFSHDGRLVVTSDSHNIVNLWSLPTGELVRTLEMGPDPNTLTTAAFSPDDRILAVGGRESRRLTFWNVFDGRLLLTYDTNLGQGVRSLSWFPDGRSIAVGRAEPTVEVIRSPTDCGESTRIRTWCRPELHGIVAKVRRGNPKMDHLLCLDEGECQVARTDDRGRARVVFLNAEAGEHSISLPFCDIVHTLTCP